MYIDQIPATAASSTTNLTNAKVLRARLEERVLDDLLRLGDTGRGASGLLWRLVERTGVIELVGRGNECCTRRPRALVLHRVDAAPNESHKGETRHHIAAECKWIQRGCCTTGQRARNAEMPEQTYHARAH